MYYVSIKVYPTLASLGTGFSGWAKTGMIPSAYLISKNIPSEGEAINSSGKFYF